VASHASTMGKTKAISTTITIAASVTSVTMRAHLGPGSRRHKAAYT
jgi:hypothetical protein